MAPTLQSTLLSNYKLPLLSDQSFPQQEQVTKPNGDHHNHLTMWLDQEDHYLSPFATMGEIIDDYVVPNYDCSSHYSAPTNFAMSSEGHYEHYYQFPSPKFNIHNDYKSGYDGLGETSSYGFGYSRLFDNGEEGYSMRSTYGNYVQANNNINAATNMPESWGFQGHMSNQASEDQNNNPKVGRYSVEERRDRILRYLKKRNQRNFNKTIKYACRKTLADRRVRVRGRFAKNHEDEHSLANNSTLVTSEEESLSIPYMNSNMDEQYYDEEWVQEAMSSLMYLPHTPVWHGDI